MLAGLVGLLPMVTSGDAVKACRVRDAIPLIPPPEYATRPVPTGWRASCLWLAGWLLSGLNM